MPIPGPTVHQQLMDAYQAVQADLESARAEILQSKDQRDQLDDQRGEALVSLAEHYLPELTPEAIHQTWLEVREAISQVLHRKDDHARRAQLVVGDIHARHQQQDQQLREINARLDRALEAQQSLAEQVERRLRDDQQFVVLSDRAAVAEAALERAEANLQEIDQDAARKLPAYDESTLFRYLYDRRYGTAEYPHRGLTRRVDRWLARLIDFNKAKQGYEFLRQTPQQMRQIIADDRQSLDTVMDELERRRDQVAEELGLPDKIRQVNELGAQRDEHLQTLAELLRESDKAQAELDEVEDPRGIYYRQAITLFREMLEMRDSRELRDQAEQTSEITDDQIVARLMGVESEIGRIDDAARRRRRQLDQSRAFLDELGRLIQKFRAAQFDTSRSNFVGSLDVLEEVKLAQEANEIDALWRRIRRSQRWGPIPAEKDANPLTQVLVNAMSQAAGDHRETHARRAGNRRAGRHASWSGDSGSWGGDSGRR